MTLFDRYKDIADKLWSAEELSFDEAIFMKTAIKEIALNWTAELTKKYGKNTGEIAEKIKAEILPRYNKEKT